MTKTIDFTVTDGIATLTIDIADRSMNVLTPEFSEDLATCIDRVASDDAIRGAVIASGKSSFFAGADLKGMAAWFDPTLPVEQVYSQVSGFQRLLRTLETCGKPFAAAINGTALGGGLEICLACHYRVAANNPKAKLGLPEVQVGLLPGGGGTQRLPRLIGLEKALTLMVQGKHLAPAEAQGLGVVNALVEPGDEVAAARRWIADGGSAQQPWDVKGFKVPGGAGLMHPKSIQTLMVGSALTQKETNNNYPAPHAILSCVYEGTVVPIDKGLAIESKYFVSLLRDPVARNMVRTLFVNKQAADKLVRRPADVPKSHVTKLGVLGAGMMGAGIAYVSAKAGMDVVLLDTEIDKAEHGKDYSRALVEKGIKRGKTTADKGEVLLAKIKTTTDYADLDGCELVIEAVFEDRGIKAAVTEKTEAVIPAEAIFASNTSTLPITGLAQASKRPTQFIGIHFFSPVDKMPLVEVILGKETEDRATAVALDYIAQIRKTPIVVHDSRGFYTSRVFGTYTREGMYMLAEGVAPALIENVAKHAGMPVGPLAVTDEVSLELSYHVMEQTRKDLGDDYPWSAADDVVNKMVVDLDRRGKRFGKGFYDYPEGEKKHLWPGLASEFPIADTQPDVAHLRQRLLYAQALDSVRCMDEGVVTDPADADIGSIFGWGFPPYTGGTISFIETEGLAEFVKNADALHEQYGDRFAVPESLRKLAASGGTFYAMPPAQQTAA
ncbi:MAG: 3-hydroxyacyl-CoA dehydrogenase NAD-binding domain-containing protein [Pseudomonadota bacterium]